MSRPRSSPDERRAKAALAYTEKHGLWYTRLPHGAVALRSPKKGPLVAAMFYVADEATPGAPAPEQWKAALSELQVAELLHLPRERVEELGGRRKLPVLGWFGPLRLYALREVLAEHEARTEATPLLDFQPKKRGSRRTRKAAATAAPEGAQAPPGPAAEAPPDVDADEPDDR